MVPGIGFIIVSVSANGHFLWTLPYMEQTLGHATFIGGVSSFCFAIAAA